jgi:hypothetical protein
MSRLLLWLGGADHTSLAHCPSERTRLSALGGAVLTTALLATAAGTAATGAWLSLPFGLALCCGIFWGLSIMNLDRWLLLTIRRQSTPPRTIALALPRLVLALVVGLVISQPLLLGIFHNEVSARALEDRQAQLAQAKKKLSGQYEQIQQLSREQSQLQASATASPLSGVLASSTDYKALSAQLAAQQKRLQVAQQAAICELDGTCGTRQRGAGPSYHAKTELATAIAAQVAATEQRLHALEGTLVQEAKAHAPQTQAFAHTRLSVVEGQLATLRAQYNSSDAELAKRYDAPMGLLDRVQALGELTSEHSDMRYIELLLTAFVLLIDGVPVLFKTLTLLGEHSLYEQIQKDGEERRFRRYAFNQEQDDVAAQISASVIVEEAQMFAKLNREVAEDRAREIMQVEREVTRQLIPHFRERAMKGVPDLAESYLARRARFAEAIRADVDRLSAGLRRDADHRRNAGTRHD